MSPSTPIESMILFRLKASGQLPRQFVLALLLDAWPNHRDIADVILLQFHIHQASRPTPRTNQDNRIDQRTIAEPRYFAPLCEDSE
jgi:hypothetical protein